MDREKERRLNGNERYSIYKEEDMNQDWSHSIQSNPIMGALPSIDSCIVRR